MPFGDALWWSVRSVRAMVCALPWRAYEEETTSGAHARRVGRVTLLAPLREVGRYGVAVFVALVDLVGCVARVREGEH